MSSKAESWLQTTLGYQFNDAHLLQQALTHRSCPGDNNERLEFLGDAVLDVVIAEVVFRSHANAPEGDLSRLRSSLVKDSSLAELSSKLGVAEHLILGGGERKSGVHRRESIRADALEAIFGAVYLDAGFEAARGVIERAYGERLSNLPSVSELRDPKTRLQEWSQARGFGLPQYELVKVSGKDHQRKFGISYALRHGTTMTNGKGSTRRNAEQEAAEKVLASLAEDDTN